MKKALFSLVGFILLFFFLDLIFPLKPNIEYSQLVLARDGTVVHEYLGKDRQWRFFARLDEITPELKNAVIYKEDKGFYHHIGVNPLAVGRALVNNIFRMHRTSGASTITMQVARMLDPKPRTYFNKCIEMFRATQMELHFSKDEILQMYFNLAPYGSNISGVKAASLMYFDKMPDHLSLAEITALSIIPNRPNYMVMGKDNLRIEKERNKWLEKYRTEDVFPKHTIDDAIIEPLNAYRHAAKGALPQLSYRLKRMNALEHDLNTTIDAAMQQKAEGITANYVNQIKHRNINNAAVLVIDNKTREILVYIGSSDFSDRINFGQVDGVKAVRSPGSTLKPLLYGLCMDKGLITAKSVLNDVPINIAGYTPENYDRTFLGLVTAEQALSNSLNIPAVKLLDTEGVVSFVQTMQACNFKSINRKNVGLSMILGGCGVSLQELSGLYCTFANAGVYKPLVMLRKGSDHKKNKETVAAVKVLTPAATYMVSKILTQLKRPDLPTNVDMVKDIPHIAWKTGTSYGRKDAWSIGYNQKYTIGVWLGNFSGLGVPDLSGATVATPLLFQLFNALDHSESAEWLERPSEVGFRLVCRETGKIPNEFCNNQVMDDYIPGVSNCERCNHLQQVWLSADEKFTYCAACLPPAGFKTKLLPYTSPELASWYEISHTKYFRLPPHNPACSKVFDGKPPIIKSLTHGMTYIIENPEEQKLQLLCATSPDVTKVYWYINDQLVKECAANEKCFFMPPPGKVKISCTDDKGRTSHIQIIIKLMKH